MASASVTMTCSNCCVGWCCLLDNALDNNPGEELLGIFPNGGVTQAKLPPTILFNGVQLSLGTMGYGNTTNGVFFQDGFWAVYINSVRRTYKCLNSYPGIKDEFPDQVNVTYSNFGLTVNAVLTRISLCEYEGFYTYDNYENYLSLRYGFFSLNTGNVWTLYAPTISRYEIDEDVVEIFLESALPSSPLDSNEPVGTYSLLSFDGLTGTESPMTVTVTAVTP